MKVYKVVQGKEGAKEYARLGSWDSLEDFCKDVGLDADSNEINKLWWLNENEVSCTVDKPLDEADFTEPIICGESYGVRCTRIDARLVHAHIERPGLGYISEKEFDALMNGGIAYTRRIRRTKQQRIRREEYS